MMGNSIGILRQMLSRMLLSIVLTVFVFGNSFAQRPDLRFEHFNTRNGLIKNFVWGIFQDHRGIMWFATENGLNKFDGYDFSVYQHNPKDSNSLRSNAIRAIYEDKQKNLWIGTSRGLHLYDRMNNNFIRFDNFKKAVEAVFEDRLNNFWVSSNYGELYVVDRVSKKFTLYIKADTSENTIGSLSSLFEDSEGTLWYVNEKEIQIIDRQSRTACKTDVALTSATSVFEDGKKNLWFSSRGGGLLLYDRHSKKHKHYKHNPLDSNSLSDNVVFSITEDKTGKLWIGTDHGGLDILDTDRKTFYNYFPNASDAESISSHSVYSFYRDKNSNIWLGTYNGGANLAIVPKFSHYKNTGNDGKGVSHNNILSFCEDAVGNVWVSTDGGGLNCYNPKKGSFVYYLHEHGNPESITNNFVTSVMEDRSGFLWAGLWNGGLEKFNHARNKITHHRHDPKDTTSLVSDNVWKVFEDSNSKLWVGTTDGLDVLDRTTKKFTHYNKVNSGLSNNSIFNIFEDADHDIWVATPDGLNLFQKKNNRFITFFNREGDPKSISNNVVISLYQDSKGRLWICTQNGLNLYDKLGNSFTKYSEEDGLPSNSMCSVLEDKKGRLWISTQNGISVFDPDTRSAKNYNVKDGLQDNEFKPYAALKTSWGEMFFGGNNGYNMFDPDNIISNTFIPPVIITDFKIFNKSIKNSPGSSVLKNYISETQLVTLSYEQSVFSFEFAALNYIVTGKNHYSYKMEGFDKDWNNVGSTRTATYTNLDPGKYIFKVKASNNDDVWNETGTSITVVITPPYWQTWWFRATVFLLAVGCVYVIISLRMKAANKDKLKLEMQVSEKTAAVTEQKETLEAQAENMLSLNEELQAQTDFLQQVNGELQLQREEAEKARKEAEKANQAKSTFLATMSHEIRTPMNGVLGMASLMAETPLTSEQKEYTDTIIGSGEALLTVINDILDFSKIESGNLELDNHVFDLRQCIENVMDVFSSKAAKKGLDLVYQIDYQIPAQIITDSHRLRQILLNLIGNAMKFTDRGEIFVGIDLLKNANDQLELAFQVRDSGIGIPQDKLSRLFKAFSQVDSSTTRKYGGTGLGLVISQRLVELMGGSIAVESQPGVGTSFSFIVKVLVSQQSIRQYVNINLLEHKGKNILVVDDNQTNLIILKNQLEQWKFSPVLASSGSQAIQVLAQQQKFDLVIADMQMPDMDGVQLAKLIKADHAFLPVILLSSIGDESKKKYPELFSAVLNKPIKQQQFSRVLQSVLRGETANITEEQKSNQVLSNDFAREHPLRILVAEDNLVNQKLTVRVLNKLGYQQIVIAQNGIEVIEKFNEQFYDIILMDVQMPEMDGLEATRLIRLKQYQQPVIISMTANAMQSDKEECMKAGMDDYISKPVKLETLVEVLEKWALKLRIDKENESLIKLS